MHYLSAEQYNRTLTSKRRELMTSIVVKDLIEDAELDSTAMSALSGGYRSGFGWIRTYESTIGSFNRPQIVNQYFTFNQYIADEIQFINQDQYVSINNSNNAVVNVGEAASNGMAVRPPMLS
jgi:hypothetical protein